MTETTSPIEPGTGVQQQAFLIGTEIYLRPLEATDAPWTVAIRSGVFPIGVETTETWLKETVEKENPSSGITLAIVRTADDVVIGSLHAIYGNFGATIEVHVDPLHGDAGQRWQADAIVVATRWMLDDRNQPSVLVQLPANETIVIDALLAADFRQTARFRQWYLRHGERVDKIALVALHPGWVQTLGDPLEAPLERTGIGEARPVPPKVTLDGDPPRNAYMVGARVYLRPFTREDTDDVVAWARRETETFFDIGRHLPQQEGYWQWTESQQKEAHPSWVRFAVCLRETDELIGEVGLLDIDYVNRTAESASFFHRPDYRGGGYGSEAKQLLLEFGFEKLGLHVIQSWVYFPNTRSAAALRKQGYTEAGRIPWNFVVHAGSFESFVVFDYLAEEWRALPRRAWDDAGS